MAELNIALCTGRHEIPQAVDGAIFRDIKSLTDTSYLESMAFIGLWNAGHRHYKKGEIGFLSPIEGEAGEDFFLELCPSLHVNIYVTGLTVSLIAVLNVCRKNGMKVTLYHYDRETGKYFPQEVAQ